MRHTSEAPIHVNREELMRLSRFGLVNTFIRCLKQLNNWDLIRYEPSKNINVGSRISIITFDKRSDNTAEPKFKKPIQNEVEEFSVKKGMTLQ